MTPPSGPGQMVLLPEMLDRLARIARENRGALGITKIESNWYYISLGEGKGLFLDAVGRHYDANQLIFEETLTCSNETSPTITRSPSSR